MSSSSYATESSIRALLLESFHVLEDEQPTAHARLRAQLCRRCVALEVDAERFAVEFSPERIHVRARDGREDARIATRRHTILDVLEARQSLQEAVLTDTVEVIGELDTLVELHRGLQIYVHGAVRCPTFPRLLQRLRASCAAPTGESHGP